MRTSASASSHRTRHHRLWPMAQAPRHRLRTKQNCARKACPPFIWIFAAEHNSFRFSWWGQLADTVALSRFGGARLVLFNWRVSGRIRLIFQNCTTTRSPPIDQDRRGDSGQRRERRFPRPSATSDGLPHPAGQRLRVGAGRSRARSARRRRMGARRRRSGDQHVHLEFGRHFDPGRRPGINTATTNCQHQQRQTFAGAQVGTDIARLN